MIPRKTHHKTKLAVIGSGLAGCAASMFAQRQGISTAQVGDTGAIAYTTGYFDLLGVSPDSLHGYADNPWEALTSLRKTEPDHILSRISPEDIQTAFVQFTQSVSRLGVAYSEPGKRNHFALLPAGGVKPTYSVPLTMLPGVQAKQAGAKTLILDIKGLQGFSAREFVANLKQEWPNLSSNTLSFPDMESGAKIYPEVMARALEVAEIQRRFAKRIKEIKGAAEFVGIPAIMGIHAADLVHKRLMELAETTLFEIPTIPPGVPGIRLREMFEQKLPAEGLVLVPHQKVKKLDLSGDQATLYVKDSFGEVIIQSEAVILATGRFLSGGLKAERQHIRETLLDISVTQPQSRESWYQNNYFDPRGHNINRSGIEVDDNFRPLDHNGKIFNKRLFAAGAVLAHHDWIRQRCGAGIAIASAYKAVQSAARFLEVSELD